MHDENVVNGQPENLKKRRRIDKRKSFITTKAIYIGLQRTAGLRNVILDGSNNRTSPKIGKTSSTPSSNAKLRAVVQD